MKDLKTEEKIKETARGFFINRGYAATKIRDIADKAGINLSLLNYYFRSKEKLFQTILAESIEEIFGPLISVMNEEIPLDKKITKLVEKEIDMFINNSELAIFVFSELRLTPEKYLPKAEVSRFGKVEVLITKQIREEIEKGTIRKIDTLQLLMLIPSLTFFPFMAKPLIKYWGNLDSEEFKTFVMERKKIIPEMIMGYLKGGNYERAGY